MPLSCPGPISSPVSSVILLVATTMPSWRMRTIVPLPRLRTYMSELPASVVLLAKPGLAISETTGARSTGTFNSGGVNVRLSPYPEDFFIARERQRNDRVALGVGDIQN